MAELTDYSAFVAVVEKGSLTAAARHLGRSLQAVSRSLGSLEREMGATLLQRTTRRNRLTAAGKVFLAHVRPALAEIARAHDAVGHLAQEAKGPIRMAAPALFGPAYLAPLLADFLAVRPGIVLELLLDHDYAEPVADGIDLALRFGELPSASLKARRIGDLRQSVFASPDYLAEAGEPRTPNDLARHRCIVRTSAREGANWRFFQDGREQDVKVSGGFRSDNAAACNEAAVLGLGIARAPTWQVRALLDAGRLAPVLAGWDLPRMPVHLLWPDAPLPNRVRQLIDHLTRTLDLGRF